MTYSLEERIAVLAGVDHWHTAASAGVPTIRVSDGPAGVRGTDWNGPRSASFPCGTALAASFDPALVREVGVALGREAQSKSAHVLLAPTVNLHRTPIGGRNFECMSEDPWLTADISAAYIDGVQSVGVACCVKHFVGNDTEYRRMTVSSNIDETTLREVYLVPFESAVAAGVRAVMTGYNRLNGVFCADHEWLLREVLRGEWAFDGVVMSDWFGLHSTVDALRAGLDLEMPGPSLHRGHRLVEAVRAGDVDESLVDDAVGRLAALASWTGAGDDDGSEMCLADPDIAQVQYRAAVAGTVLLRNNNQLPWPTDVGTVAVIGPYADIGRPQGGGSARVRPDHISPIVASLEDRGLNVVFSQGCSIERFHRPLSGPVTMVITDDVGRTHTAETSATVAFWQDEPALGLSRRFSAAMTTEFTPTVTGTWTVGARSAGECVIAIDGDEILRIAADDRGGSFFEHGSPERVASVELVAGTPITIQIDYPIDDHTGIRAFSVGMRPPAGDDPVQAAVDVAARADRVLLVVGTDDDWETESRDRNDMHLPGRQDELIAAVAAVNPATTVVVNAGSPVTMDWRHDVAAVMQIWFPGGAIGDAVADLITGIASPGGRLPVTIPEHLGDTPAAAHYPGADDTMTYGEGPAIGHRWYWRRTIEPAYWFGYGLMYGTTSWGPAEVSGDITDCVEVAVPVTNDSDRTLRDVVQVYVVAPDVDGPAPLRFVGAATVDVAPGATVTATVHIPARRVSQWTAQGHAVAAGMHEIRVGRHAGDTEVAARHRVPHEVVLSGDARQRLR